MAVFSAQRHKPPLQLRKLASRVSAKGSTWRRLPSLSCMLRLASCCSSQASIQSPSIPRSDAEELDAAVEVALRLEAQVDGERAGRGAVEHDGHADEAELLP